MATQALIRVIENQDLLEQVSDKIQPAIKQAFIKQGETGRQLKNALHGTWLGHPLHPVLTYLPLGAWTTALTLDAIDALSGRKEFAAGADAAVAVGLVGAVGAAVTGLTDWSETNGRPRRIGLAHGLLNAGATLLYTTSLLMRRRKGSRQTGLGLAMLGFAVSCTAAYLGGHLVFGEQVGVNHAAWEQLPADFVPVLDESALSEGQMTKVDVKGIPVLLLKQYGEIHALAHNCTHQGGPLSEGKLEGEIVQCPWHGSRFSIKDGSVVDGPATFPQPCFETRVRNGQIEVSGNHNRS